MKFKIPLTFSNVEVLKKRAKRYLKFIKVRKDFFKSLEEDLDNCDVDLNKNEYLAICLRSFFWSFLILLTVFTSVLGIFQVPYFFFYGLGAALVFSGFILISQINYPKMYSFRKLRNIEKNLIPAMQDMLVQLNSGVPLFEIMINISDAGYGETSLEFKKIVRKINSGEPQIQAIDEIGKLNKSPYFKRVLWQISNGMRAGSDMIVVIREGINNLSKEQAIQIQSYGSRLNPLIMFYMLLTVILPALMITFLTIITSMVNLSSTGVQLIFIGIFVLVIFMQIMFLGMIRTRRPSLI